MRRLVYITVELPESHVIGNLVTHIMGNLVTYKHNISIAKVRKAI